jgi:hypothetical protein
MDGSNLGARTSLPTHTLPQTTTDELGEVPTEKSSSVCNRSQEELLPYVEELILDISHTS